MSLRLTLIVLLSVVALPLQAQQGFPVVDKATQKARDVDRRLILDTELQAERAELVAAQALVASAPTQDHAAAVHRHEENVKALLRELGQRPSGALLAKQVTPQITQQVTPPAQPVQQASPAPQANRAPVQTGGWDAANAWDK